MSITINDDDEEAAPETISIVAPVKKINYLNNKDMLKEIHRSKSSFCEFTDPKYVDYDVIVEKLEEIHLPEVQEKAKAARAQRMSVTAFEAALANTTSNPETVKHPR